MSLHLFALPPPSCNRCDRLPCRRKKHIARQHWEGKLLQAAFRAFSRPLHAKGVAEAALLRLLNRQLAAAWAGWRVAVVEGQAQQALAAAAGGYWLLCPQASLHTLNKCNPHS